MRFAAFLAVFPALVTIACAEAGGVFDRTGCAAAGFVFAINGLLMIGWSMWPR